MRTEPLGAGIHICVSDRHHFTTDTILLADFAAPKKSDNAVDLGTGCGTIPLLWAREDMPRSVVAVEIQDEAIALLQESIALNRAAGHDAVGRITPLLCDINALGDHLNAGEYDLAVCNPPYKLSGAGLTNPDPARELINHETGVTLEDICRAASRLLRFGGRFCLCQRPERISDILESMRRHQIEPKRLRLVQGRAKKAPKLVLVEGKRGANTGFLQVMPTLIVERDDGSFTDEMNAIYGCYKEDATHG